MIPLTAQRYGLTVTSVTNNPLPRVAGAAVMDCVRLPRTLRSRVPGAFFDETGDANAGRKVTVACLIAVASITGAEAQSPLPPVTVDAPVARKQPAATKPTAEQVRVRTALRRAAQAKQAAQAAAARRPPRRAGARPRSLCRSGGALQGGPAGVAEIHRADGQYAEDGHRPHQGSSRGQERHESEGGRRAPPPA